MNFSQCTPSRQAWNYSIVFVCGGGRSGGLGGFGMLSASVFPHCDTCSRLRGEFTALPTIVGLLRLALSCFFCWKLWSTMERRSSTSSASTPHISLSKNFRHQHQPAIGAHLAVLWRNLLGTITAKVFKCSPHLLQVVLTRLPGCWDTMPSRRGADNNRVGVAGSTGNGRGS